MSNYTPEQREAWAAYKKAKARADKALARVKAHNTGIAAYAELAAEASIRRRAALAALGAPNMPRDPRE